MLASVNGSRWIIWKQLKQDLSGFVVNIDTTRITHFTLHSCHAFKSIIPCVKNICAVLFNLCDLVNQCETEPSSLATRTVCID